MNMMKVGSVKPLMSTGMELRQGVILTEEEASALLNFASMSTSPIDPVTEVALRKLSSFVTKHMDPVACQSGDSFCHQNSTNSDGTNNLRNIENAVVTINNPVAV